MRMLCWLASHTRQGPLRMDGGRGRYLQDGPAFLRHSCQGAVPAQLAAQDPGVGFFAAAQ